MARADDDPGSLYTTDADGWATPTTYGLEAEAAVRAAGAAVAARGEQLAREQLGLNGPSQDKAVLDFVPERASSREEYGAAIQARKTELRAKIDQLRSEAQQPGPGPLSIDKASKMMAKIVESDELVPEANRYITEVNRFHQGDSAWDRVENRAYSNGYQAAVAEQVDIGLRDGNMISVDDASQKAPLERLKRALAYYPSSWLDNDSSYETPVPGTSGTQRVPLRVVTSRRRASYSHWVQETRTFGDGRREIRDFAQLTIDKRDEGCLSPGISTAIHEYGHRAEQIQPTVNALAQAHLARRTQLATGERHDLEPYLVSKSRTKRPPPANWNEFRGESSEWTRPDDFAEQYTGRQYPSTRVSEVFTTGMEGVFAGRFGGLRGTGRWKADTEHRDLILGTLTTVR